MVVVGKMGNSLAGTPHRVRCGVFVPVRHNSKRSETDCQPNEIHYHRTPQSQLDEAVGLASAIDLNIVSTDIIRVATPTPATLMGAGKVSEFGDIIKDQEIEVVIVDHPLTPVQQRNLERAWNAKVLDRTGIILEIFGARAQTKEGRLQVDLAAHRYQRGRLVRSWTHLERQRGGAGFLGGPGETQIESDRRALQVKIERLEKQLDQVRQTRALHRKQRKKREVPVIAFVGYTNAGKSTLFNTITGAGVFAKNLLFATLDPTLRQLTLPDATEAVLSDTVGFISNLPTDLIAAFRATLEEVTEANIIIHVRDISHEDTHAQADDVEHVLRDLGVDVKNTETLKQEGRHYFEVWNKIDRLDEEQVAALKKQAEYRNYPQVLFTSATTRDGVDQVLAYIENLLHIGQRVKTITVSGKQLTMLHMAYKFGNVIERQDLASGDVIMRIRSDRWREINRYLII